MKTNLFRRIATAMFFTTISTVEIFSQSVKYNGDTEVDVVASQKFATAQVGLSTTHGVYLSKPKLFIGAGASVGWNIDAEFWNNVYPVYGDIRKDFTINRLFTTFVEAKAGYTFKGNPTGVMSDSGVDYGFYCYPSIGLRVRTSDHCGVYLKMGYTYQNTTMSWYAGGEKIDNSKNYNAGGFSVSLGFSF